MKVHARIDGIVAREAPVAVVFRRGPSKLTQLLLWHLDTDEVEPGQWIRGRVYTRRCDLSPDGRYLVGAFTNYSATRRPESEYSFKEPWMTSGWTAVSRPPYFTALALWFSGDAWNGGGIWKGNDLLELNSLPGWQEAKPVSGGIRMRPLGRGRGEDEPLFSLLLAMRGWSNGRALKTRLINPNWRQVSERVLRSLQGKPEGLGDFEGLLIDLQGFSPRYEVERSGLWIKPFAGGTLQRTDHYSYEVWEACDTGGKPHLRFEVPQFGSQFLDVDQRGRVVYGDKGCLWAWDGFPNGQPTLVADLNGEKFEPVPPPEWATSWD